MSEFQTMVQMISERETRIEEIEKMLDALADLAEDIAEGLRPNRDLASAVDEARALLEKKPPASDEPMCPDCLTDIPFHLCGDYPPRPKGPEHGRTRRATTKAEARQEGEDRLREGQGDGGADEATEEPAAGVAQRPVAAPQEAARQKVSVPLFSKEDVRVFPIKPDQCPHCDRDEDVITHAVWVNVRITGTKEEVFRGCLRHAGLFARQMKRGATRPEKKQ